MVLEIPMSVVGEIVFEPVVGPHIGVWLEQTRENRVCRRLDVEISPAFRGRNGNTEGTRRRVKHEAVIEHFQAKWIPVRVKKMRQNKELERCSDSAGSESALVPLIDPDPGPEVDLAPVSGKK